MGDKNKFSISFVYADTPQELNTSNYLCFNKGKSLAKAGYSVSLIPIQLFQQDPRDSKQAKDAEDACANSHVLVIERNLIGDVLTRLMYQKVRAKVVILCWDDGYHTIQPENASYRFWHDGTVDIADEKGEVQPRQLFPHPYTMFTWGVKMGHAATLPSLALCQYWEPAIPTYHLRNYFETEYYINKPQKVQNGKITIGWGVSLSHFQSFRDSGIMQALKNVIQVRNNVEFLICGDKSIYDAFEVPETNKRFQGYVPFTEWGSVISSQFDIGIAPLAGEYDLYRSWIKGIEYQLCQKPWIASSGPAYQELSQFGKLVDNSEENWTKSLLDTIDNLENEREKAKGEPYQFALHQDVYEHAEEMADLYREIAKTHAGILL